MRDRYRASAGAVVVLQGLAKQLGIADALGHTPPIYAHLPFVAEPGSRNKLSKRKTDGVYYTPEWTVGTIVEQTVGARLEAIKTELGFDTLPPLDEAAIAGVEQEFDDRVQRLADAFAESFIAAAINSAPALEAAAR